MKRFLVLLLSVVLTVGMLSLTTFAEEEPAAEPEIVLEAEEPAEGLAEETIIEEVGEEPEAQPEEVAAEAEEAQPEETVAEPEEPAAEPEAVAEPVAEAEEIAEPAAEPEVIAEPAEEQEADPSSKPEEAAPAKEPEEIVVPEEEVVLEKADAKDISSATVTIKYSSLGYTGKPRTQSNSTVVTFSGKTLVKGTDYKITYKNNTNVGTATMTVTGIGKYTGSVKKTFKITPASIAKANVTLRYSSLVYSGYARTQSGTTVVKLVLAGATKTLVCKTDYTISYTNNVNVGTATMTIKGKGNFTGSVKKTFKITAKKLTSATLKYRAMKYTGEPRKNTVTVYGMYKGKKTVLTENKDYQLTYTDNTKVGLATVKVKGIGNYKGTITKTFTIKPTNLTFTRTWVEDRFGYKGKITASGGANWTVNVDLTSAREKDWITCGEIGVSNGMYFYYTHGEVHAVDIVTGKEVWYTDYLGMETARFAFDEEDGTMYLASYHNMSVVSIETDGTVNGTLYISQYQLHDDDSPDAVQYLKGIKSVKSVRGKHQFIVESEHVYDETGDWGEHAEILFDGKTLDVLYFYFVGNMDDDSDA